MIVIVSAASNNYSKELSVFIQSAYSTITLPFSLIVYDLGDLSQEFKHNLSASYPLLIWKQFDYSKYPDYYQVKVNAGEYAWKSACLYETLMCMQPGLTSNEDHFLLWCDAGNYVDENIEELLIYTKNKLIYSPYSNGTISKWTHPTVLRYFGIENNVEFLNKLNRNGAIMSFYVNNANVQKLLKDFYEYSKIKDAICPEGSSRANHRQDQALFTILFFQFMNKHGIEVENWYRCIKFHYHY